MPSQTGQSQLSALIAPIAAGIEKRKGQDIKTDSGGQLPPGIEGGVAQLSSVKIVPVKEGGKNAGKLQFIVSAVAKAPLKHGELMVRGTQFNLPIIPLYDTERIEQGQKITITASEHYNKPGGVADMVMALLGKDKVDPAFVGADKVLGTLAALTKAKPHFKFRTWAGNKQDVYQKDGKFWCGDVDDKGQPTGNRKPNGPYPSVEAAKKANQWAGTTPRTNVVFQSVIQGYVDSPNAQSNGAAVNGAPNVQDDTGATSEPEADEVVTEAATATAAGTEGDEDLDALAEAAGGEGKPAEEAGDTLVRLGVEAGLDASAIQAADTWQAAVAMIREARAGGGSSEDSVVVEEEVDKVVEEPESPAEPWKPAKGEACDYFREVTVENKKTKKRTKERRKFEVSIKTSNQKNKTATVEDLSTKKVYENVPWSDLRQSDIPF